MSPRRCFGIAVNGSVAEAIDAHCWVFKTRDRAEAFAEVVEGRTSVVHGSLSIEAPLQCVLRASVRDTKSIIHLDYPFRVDVTCERTTL